MNIESVLVWGGVATVVLATMEAAGQWLGLTRLSTSFLLGTMLTRQRDRAGPVGFVAHLALGLAIAFLYALVFEAAGRATWWLGLLLGALHSLFVLFAVMPIVPTIHPRMARETDGPTPTANLQPPGFLALNYGRQTFLVSLAGHIAYGLILGALYTTNG